MVLTFVIVLALVVVCLFFGAIISFIGEIKNGFENNSNGRHLDERNFHFMGFNDDSRKSPEHIAPRLTIIGKAASTGRMKTMMDMMIAMTDFGTRENFNQGGLQLFG